MSSSDPKIDLNNDLENDPIVIVGAARTPMGGFQGDFSNVTAAELGAASIAGAISNAGVANEDVEEFLGAISRNYLQPRWCGATDGRVQRPASARLPESNSMTCSAFPCDNRFRLRCWNALPSGSRLNWVAGT